MSAELATVGAAVEQVLIGGDLSKLTPEQRVSYYKAVCDSVGLNPLTRPFDYITLNGKLTLYAKRDCTDQLRSRPGKEVSVKITDRATIEGVYVVTAQATDKGGRTDESTGAVNIAGLKGDFLANAFMKAETKAKRRVTLSICGLGLLDETEVESIPDARPHVERPALTENGKAGGQHETPSPDAEENFAKFREAIRDSVTRNELETVGGLIKATAKKLSSVHADLLRKEYSKRLDALTDAEEAAAVAADNRDIPN